MKKINVTNSPPALNQINSSVLQSISVFEVPIFVLSNIRTMIIQAIFNIRNHLRNLSQLFLEGSMSEDFLQK